MKKVLRLITLLFLVHLYMPSSACTSFLVGKNASACGSTFITYSADSYGMYGKLIYLPAEKYAQGALRRIVDGDTNKFMGYIPEASETFAVMGNINEYQVAITETTFGGRPELVDSTGVIDYVSLMTLGLQRAKTAREAIKVMTELVEKYGYASEGESFSIADPNEVWILEMIGKGNVEKGAVWVAVRIPDDCIAAHANHSRIHQFLQYKKEDVMYAKDVISFARKQGYFNGKDADFSFSSAYAPEDFSALRYCEARVWSFYNKWSDGMNEFVKYASGTEPGKHCPMPLFIKPNRPLSLQDIKDCMRDHYEGTPFDVTKDVGAGVYCAPYRPSPLTWEYNGKNYFNERPISTQQAAFTVVAQMRSTLPNPIGGILWYGNDDPNMIAYTPIYCNSRNVPTCYNAKDANDHTFSWESAFWVCNWVSNMVYPRYSQLFPEVKALQNKLEEEYATGQNQIEKEALELYSIGKHDEAIMLLDAYGQSCAQKMLSEWKKLGERIIVKYNDQVVKIEKDGKYELTPDGLIVPPHRPGFDKHQREYIIRETKDKFLVP